MTDVMKTLLSTESLPTFPLQCLVYSSGFVTLDKRVDQIFCPVCFFRPSLLNVFILYLSLAKWNTIVLATSVRLCELHAYSEQLYKLVFMDI